VTQSLELLLDDDLEAAVRREWAALAAADLPSQARHTAETNRPHITLCVASAIPPYVETALKAALTGRLPIDLRLGGLLCFPARDATVVLARAVVPNVELLELQAICAALYAGLPGDGQRTQPGGWTAHVTLARDIPVEQVGKAIVAIGDVPDSRIDRVGTAVAARRGNAETRTAWRVG
jgi:2'-5' RNA ligase